MYRQQTSDKALLIIDINDRFFDKKSKCYEEGSERILPFIKGEIQYFRERGRLIVFVYTNKSSLAEENSNERSSSVINLKPQADDKIIYKKSPSSFYDTGLSEILDTMGIKRIMLSGVATDTSILLTAADAVFQGYKVTVPETCVFCKDKENQEFSLKLIRETWNCSFTIFK